MFGPHLEDQLRPSGHTLRHFPQSFRFSTLGGWIATRSSGHYATNHTHIDDFVRVGADDHPGRVVGNRAACPAPARDPAPTGW